MKKLLFIILITIFMQNTFAQYRPLLVDGSEWYHHEVGGGWDAYMKEYIIIDTVVNSVSYKKIKYYLAEYKLCREDTLQEIVYEYINDSTEIILYDFSLLVGQSFQYVSENYLITRVDSMLSDSLNSLICVELDSTKKI